LITFENGLQLELADLLATDAFASALAKALTPGLCLYLHGNLGAGKTTLVRAMLSALGHNGSIKSPTYSLVELYSVDGMDFYHFDLYRLSNATELDYIGIRDYMLTSAICVFEWADRGMGFIPAADIEITLDFAGEGRSAVLLANTPKGLQVLKDLTMGYIE